MGNSSLKQVQRLVDHLTPLDQVRLLAYLTTRIARVVESMHPAATTSTSDNITTWEEFFHIGDALAASDTPESQTLTEAIFTMRR